MQGRGRGIRGFMEQLCGEGGDVYEGWTASERKGSCSVCRRLETGSRQWIGQRTLFKLVGQGGLANQAQSGQDYSSSNIRQGNAGLKCVSLNARSIMNKKSELNIMVNDSDPHIIGITESWANRDITDAELGLEGYVMFRKDRMGRRGGGVLLYVKDTIPAQALTLGLWVQWPGGPVDLKTYWPPKKLTGPPKNLLAPQKTNWSLPQNQTCATKNYLHKPTICT